ncbi:hypothetical protein C8F04DRAFT_1137716 [Mycena alexandri]|uniref:F-box domain-containing protein n=1 Tax=Mycena alexandri TaxID=1745969 RepID=A0AAD6WRH8_9AGAR|nr:hypothetical protein C8F04DRAFT_1137716 [Mycena alexandri]
MTRPCWKCGAPATIPQLEFPQTTESSLALSDLLSSNEVPDEKITLQIRDIVSNGQAQVDALDIQINSLAITLAQLMRSRDKIAERVRQHRAIISSVRRVPQELLCEIFAAAVLPDEETTANEGNIANPPWHLGHICRAWRHAALGYAPLWSSITIPSSTLPVRSRILLPQVKAQLHRSANAPLDIILRDIQPDVSIPLLDPVFAHSNRWRSLCLHFDHLYPRTPLKWLHPVDMQLDQLEKLEIAKAYDTEIPDIFSAAARLRQVILCDWRFEIYSPFVTIPWHQITHYRGTYAWTRQIQILEAAPNLVDCVLGFESFDDSSSNDLVVMNHLCRLRIEKPGFLIHLTAPSLRTLHCVYNSESLLSLLPAFILRSSCSLQELSLTDCAITSELIMVLQSLPNLTSLFLESDGDVMAQQKQSVLFEAFTISGTSHEYLCPNLTSFVYGFPLRFPHELFFAMLRSRVGESSPSPSPRWMFLRLFDAHENSDICPPEMATLFETLRATGCDAAFLGEDGTDRLKAKGVVF